ncbi:hypothetical protein SKAU_G00024440 [Synaphobranchus kaupii]|uniref:Uncharacterized protein n=1 Tax=Synaphobranchus kaupii TaxID=118154 RepID=A0A9Q1GDQ5_SYNKA|nr:hypothetical protein SKAU_G00024440 [Synaphobranchus kaupii]
MRRLFPSPTNQRCLSEFAVVGSIWGSYGRREGDANANTALRCGRFRLTHFGLGWFARDVSPSRSRGCSSADTEYKGSLLFMERTHHLGPISLRNSWERPFMSGKGISEDPAV